VSSIEKRRVQINDNKTRPTSKWLIPIPILGVLSYAILFLIAKTKYAGGLEEYHMDKDLMCDIMEKVSKGGFSNVARPIAVTGHILLFIGMTTFFYLLPRIFNKRNINMRIFQISGMISMVLLLFVFTDYHDILVLFAGVAGFICCIPLIYEYSKLRVSSHKVIAIICLALSLIAFLSYQTKIGFTYFPIFQKFVFVLDGIWVFLVCRQLRSQ